MKRILMPAVLFFLLSALCISVRAAEPAADISGPGLVTDQQGFSDTSSLFDGNVMVERCYAANSRLTLEAPDGIGSLYLIFNQEYGAYSLTNNDTGQTVRCGQYGFLHDFLDMEALFGSVPASVTLYFETGELRLNELYIFSPGEVPDFVQKWQPPAEGKTDILLFSTHGDDEQLFFAGLLPYYHGELGCNVQVVYYTDHRNMSQTRCHEMLDGLWAVGVTTYPVMGPYMDLLVTTMQQAYDMNEFYGISREEVQEFVVTQLRRFKPMVAVGHDPVNGEYGHGQHMMYADLLCNALELAPDPEQFPESAKLYGTGDVPKTYLHLWPENTITMDWDQPLERFGGRTAYEVTKELGYPCHKSQYLDFLWYFSGVDAAADIPKYSPCAYGLYRSTVGPDVEKNDMLENVLTYAQQAEEKARAEAECAAEEDRLAAEEVQPETSLPETQPCMIPVETVPDAVEESEEAVDFRRLRQMAGLLGIMLLAAVAAGFLRPKKYF